MDLAFRTAEAADVDRACPLIYSAGIEGFDYTFAAKGRTALDFIRHAFVDGRGFFGHRNHEVVVVDGAVVGTGAFYTGADYDALGKGLVPQVLHLYGLGAIGVFRRSLEMTPLMPRPARDTLYVADLGVAPAMRGRGIGTALLQRHLDRAREEGLRRYELDVSVSNPRGQQLYERFGFRVTREQPTHGKGGVPSTRRMTIDL